MRRKGFAFPYPTSLSDKDEAFQRCLRAAEADPDKIYNAFPQIACPDNYAQACTHPLINTYYLNTCNPDAYFSDIKHLVTFIHEYAHAQFDFTPAKVLARLILSAVYSKLDELFLRKAGTGNAGIL